MKTMSSSA
jgi:hypothetical protein